MSKLTVKGLLLCCAALAFLITTACAFSSNITFRNRTGGVLTPFPVKTTPSPPHREADSASDIGGGDTASIDPDGFNPVYYATGITDTTKANGVYIGLALDDDPMMIQYKVFHYKVPPGQAGHDPAKQPILLHQGVEEVSDVDLMITASRWAIPGVPLPPGGWRVIIVPE